MANTYFQFKQFKIEQNRSAMKVTTDACLFGAWAAEQIQIQENKASTLLDIGAGTGLLSLMVAQKNPSLKIDAVEIESGAAAQALENFEESPFPHLNLIQSDIQQFTNENLYDVIISNPPFYENQLTSPKTIKNLAHHDSSLLFEDWMAIVKRLIKTSGIFYLLMPSVREAEIDRLFKKEGVGVLQKVVVYPTENHAHAFRHFYAATFGEEINKKESQLFIKTKDSVYSESFVHYLKDYYLYL